VKYTTYVTKKICQNLEKKIEKIAEFFLLNEREIYNTLNEENLRQNLVNFEKIAKISF